MATAGRIPSLPKEGIPRPKALDQASQGSPRTLRAAPSEDGTALRRHQEPARGPLRRDGRAPAQGADEDLPKKAAHRIVNQGRMEGTAPGPKSGKRRTLHRM